MAGATPSQQQHQQTPLDKTSMTPEEEFMKRNTDCVYFLASPLTCKKGSECEYRHSEIARLNPRDCWYWLNGNCLNPKCAFRHPPLDGLLGIKISTPVAPLMPQLQTPAAPAANSPYIMSKQGVPCIFFQKGYCLKGDKCPFLHPSTSGTSKVALSTASAPVTEPPIAKKTFGILEKCTQEQKDLQINIPESVDFPQRKPAVPPARNGVVEKNIPKSLILDDELPRYRARSIPATSEISSGRSNRGYQAHVTDNDSALNGKDADEFSREPSPGFDVLVDDELRGSDYYPPSEDQFGRTSRHEGRNMNPMNDYDMGPSSDYKSMADVEQDVYHDSRDYDSYERLQGGHYGWEEQRLSSERELHIQRRRYPRDQSTDESVDLRQHISKQRKGGDGLRSVISRDGHIEDRDYWKGPRRESHMAQPTHDTLSSRLRGRIEMPGRSISPEKESVGRHRTRLSPGRLHAISNHGRLRDRIKGRVEEDFREGRDSRGRIRRDGMTDINSKFSGPKRLSELKGGKLNELQINGPQTLGKRKYPKVETLQQSEDDLSFEGPKPLSEILKQKRGATPQESRSGAYNNEDTNKAVKSTVIDGNKEVSNYASTETEKSKSTDEEETEEGLIGNFATEENQPENFDHREVNFEGEDYNLEEGENGEEYLDEDEGDGFAKQMGVELL